MRLTSNKYADHFLSDKKLLQDLFCSPFADSAINLIEMYFSCFLSQLLSVSVNHNHGNKVLLMLEFEQRRWNPQHFPMCVIFIQRDSITEIRGAKNSLTHDTNKVCEQSASTGLLPKSNMEANQWPTE